MPSLFQSATQENNSLMALNGLGAAFSLLGVFISCVHGPKLVILSLALFLLNFAGLFLQLSESTPDFNCTAA